MSNTFKDLSWNLEGSYSQDAIDRNGDAHVLDSSLLEMPYVGMIPCTN